MGQLEMHHCKQCWTIYTHGCVDIRTLYRRSNETQKNNKKTETLQKSLLSLSAYVNYEVQDPFLPLYAKEKQNKENHDDKYK